jgi:hypothetical protein
VATKNHAKKIGTYQEQNHPERPRQEVKESAFRKCARLEIREPVGDPRHWLLRIARLDGLGAREKTAVDGIHDRLSGNLPATKETAVETLDGVLAALDSIELEVDIALGVWI